ncbi:MAG: CPBP family intramembrane metalloprotease [Elusimicrobia bacterium]|nr:CPBP family intramembrane metalloprotease [Elusimicrobiota bacterium]
MMRLKKLISTILLGSFIQALPGPHFYQALAQREFAGRPVEFSGGYRSTPIPTPRSWIPTSPVGTSQNTYSYGPAASTSFTPRTANSLQRSHSAITSPRTTPLTRTASHAIPAGVQRASQDLHRTANEIASNLEPLRATNLSDSGSVSVLSRVWDLLLRQKTSPPSFSVSQKPSSVKILSRWFTLHRLISSVPEIQNHSTPPQDPEKPPQSSLSRSFKVGALTMLLVTAMELAFTYVPMIFGYHTETVFGMPFSTHANQIETGKNFYDMVLMSPVSEEVVYRAGAVGGTSWALSKMGISKKTAFWISAVASSVLFSLSHTNYPVSLVTRLTAGLILSYVYRQEGLMAAIAGHGFMNLQAAVAAFWRHSPHPWLAIPTALLFCAVMAFWIYKSEKDLRRELPLRKAGKIVPYRISARDAILMATILGPAFFLYGIRWHSLAFLTYAVPALSLLAFSVIQTVRNHSFKPQFQPTPKKEHDPSPGIDFDSIYPQIRNLIVQGYLQEAMEKIAQVESVNPKWADEHIMTWDALKRTLQQKLDAVYRAGEDRADQPLWLKAAEDATYFHLGSWKPVWRGFPIHTLQDMQGLNQCTLYSLHNAIMATQGYTKPTTVEELLSAAKTILKDPALGAERNGLTTEEVQKVATGLGIDSKTIPFPRERDLRKLLQSGQPLLAQQTFFRKMDTQPESSPIGRYAGLKHTVFLRSAFWSPAQRRWIYMVADSGLGKVTFYTYQELRGLVKELHLLTIKQPIQLPEHDFTVSDNLKRIFQSPEELRKVTGINLEQMKVVKDRLVTIKPNGEERKPMHDPVRLVEIGGKSYVLRIMEQIQTIDVSEIGQSNWNLGESEIEAAEVIRSFQNEFPQFKVPESFLVRQNGKSLVLQEFIPGALMGEEKQAAWNALDTMVKAQIFSLAILLGNSDTPIEVVDNILLIPNPVSQKLDIYLLDNEFSFQKLDPVLVGKNIAESGLPIQNFTSMLPVLQKILSDPGFTQSQAQSFIQSGVSREKAEKDAQTIWEHAQHLKLSLGSVPNPSDGKTATETSSAATPENSLDIEWNSRTVTRYFYPAISFMQGYLQSLDQKTRQKIIREEKAKTFKAALTPLISGILILLGSFVIVVWRPTFLSFGIILPADFLTSIVILSVVSNITEREMVKSAIKYGWKPTPENLERIEGVTPIHHITRHNWEKTLVELPVTDGWYYQGELDSFLRDLAQAKFPYEQTIKLLQFLREKPEPNYWTSYIRENHLGYLWDFLVDDPRLMRNLAGFIYTMQSEVISNLLEPQAVLDQVITAEAALTISQVNPHTVATFLGEDLIRIIGLPQIQKFNPQGYQRIVDALEARAKDRNLGEGARQALSILSALKKPS